MEMTPIPEAELDVFKQLRSLKVIFDVGARTDTAYISIWPKSEFHLFEVNPIFFDELVKKVKNNINAVLNNFGLGDTSGYFAYDVGTQSLKGGEAYKNGSDLAFPVFTLDEYVKENKVRHIDFLKIDTEGYDFKVLNGGKSAIKKTRFIQYEYWDNLMQFHDLLDKDFDLIYIGYRNVLCMNKKLVAKQTRLRIKKYIEDKGYKLLA